MKTFTTSAGRNIRYIDEGSGPPLVFLHAFPLSPAQWEDQIAVCATNWRCLAPAAPGFGSDPFDTPASLLQIGDDLAALLDGLDIHDPIVLCGLSMGGYAGQWFAHRFPDRIRALVLCDTRASADDDATRTKRDENIAFAASHSPAEFVDRVRPSLLGDTSIATRPEVTTLVNEIASQHPPKTFADGTAALRDRPDMKAWLPEIKVPTLLIFGDEDKLAPQAEIEILQEIQGAELVTIIGAGHLTNLETPIAFNDALLGFLDGLTPI